MRIFVHYPLNTELANFAAKTVLLPGKLPTCKDISMQTVHYTKVYKGIGRSCGGYEHIV